MTHLADLQRWVKEDPVACSGAFAAISAQHSYSSSSSGTAAAAATTTTGQEVRLHHLLRLVERLALSASASVATRPSTLDFPEWPEGEGGGEAGGAGGGGSSSSSSVVVLPCSWLLPSLRRVADRLWSSFELLGKEELSWYNRCVRARD